MIFLPSRSAYLTFLETRLATVGLSCDGLGALLPAALERAAARLSLDSGKYHRDDAGRPTLRTAHYSQMALLLHDLARAAHLAGDDDTADRIYFLNVGQSGCDLHYAVDLPLRTHCDHPLGAIIGRGRFAPHIAFVFSDGCCIGNNWGVYPEIAGHPVMSGHSAVIGATEIRGTVVLARGATLIDAGVVEDSMVFGSGPGLVRRPLDRERAAALIPFAIADVAPPA